MQALSKIKLQSDTIVKLLPLFAFAAPLVLLYCLNPADPYIKLSAQASFQLMWKGRILYLFFIWLIVLEFVLGWETLKPKINKQNKAKLAAFAVALLLPTLYVLSEYYLGLNGAIASWSLKKGVYYYNLMPLSAEYLVFSVLFCSVALLYFGKKGLERFTLPSLFAGLVGIIFVIDNVFPFGEFTPFQIMVPTTATLAAKTLNLMGCTTSMTTVNQMLTLKATGPLGTAQFSIAWPCAGIDSFLIFTAVILLFLQQLQISWRAKAAFFVIGAAVTYFINVLNIVTIFTIAMQYGLYSNQELMFHSYYGPTYPIIWIVSFPTIILVGQGLWRRRKIGKTANDGNLTKPQRAQLNPA